MALSKSTTRRHFSYMQACCERSSCYSDFTDLVERLVGKEFEVLFEYCHKDVATSPDDMLYTVPNVRKWKEFLFDYNDYDTVVKLENEWTTNLHVNSLGRDKIFMTWRVMEQYRGRYNGRGLTRNMIDIKIAIPKLNLKAYEHFCFRHFDRSRGSPSQVLPFYLRRAMAQLYNRFYIDENPRPAVDKYKYLCKTCTHDRAEPIPDHVLCSIPEWYYEMCYPEETGAKRVSTFTMFTSVVTVD